VQLSQDGEGLEDALGRLRVVAPVPPGEGDLHHLLAGAEAVEDVAAGEPLLSQAVVDAASKIAEKFRARPPRRLVDREVRRAGEGRGDAAQRGTGCE